MVLSTARQRLLAIATLLLLSSISNSFAASTALFTATVAVPSLLRAYVQLRRQKMRIRRRDRRAFLKASRRDMIIAKNTQRNLHPFHQIYDIDERDNFREKYRMTEASFEFLLDVCNYVHDIYCIN